MYNHPWATIIRLVVYMLPKLLFFIDESPVCKFLSKKKRNGKKTNSFDFTFYRHEWVVWDTQPLRINWSYFWFPHICGYPVMESFRHVCGYLVHGNFVPDISPIENSSLEFSSLRSLYFFVT